MPQPGEYERLIEWLRHASRQEEFSSPEVREQNLRRLVRSARPEAEVPVALQRRIQALIAADRARKPSLLTRLLRRLGLGAPHGELYHLERWLRGLAEEERTILGLLLSRDMAPLPEEIVGSETVTRLVGQMIDCLPASRRDALLLQLAYGLSMKEIARVTGRSVAVTRRMLEEARAAVDWVGRRGA
jgi:DNA-directed RNA polymerase specialized sigma24 family protein